MQSKGCDEVFMIQIDVIAVVHLSDDFSCQGKNILADQLFQTVLRAWQ